MYTILDEYKSHNCTTKFLFNIFFIENILKYNEKETIQMNIFRILHYNFSENMVFVSFEGLVIVPKSFKGEAQFPSHN